MLLTLFVFKARLTGFFPSNFLPPGRAVVSYRAMISYHDVNILFILIYLIVYLFIYLFIFVNYSKLDLLATLARSLTSSRSSSIN